MCSGRHHRAVQIICHEGINEDSETLSISRNVTCIILNEPVGMDRVGLIRHQIGIHFALTTGRTHRCGQVGKRTRSIVDSIWRLEQVFTSLARRRALGVDAGDRPSKDHCAWAWRCRGARRRKVLGDSLCGRVIARIYAELLKIIYTTQM